MCQYYDKNIKKNNTEQLTQNDTTPRKSDRCFHVRERIIEENR